MKRNSHPVEVTDHAVLRYIERALNIDVEEIRQTIADKYAAGAMPVTYFFEEGIIRLTEGDFRHWQEMFSNLNLKAELTQLAQWAKEQGRRKWYFAVQGALNRRNREVGIVSAAARAAAVAAGSKKEMLGGGYA